MCPIDLLLGVSVSGDNAKPETQPASDPGTAVRLQVETDLCRIRLQCAFHLKLCALNTAVQSPDTPLTIMLLAEKVELAEPLIEFQRVMKILQEQNANHLFWVFAHVTTISDAMKSAMSKIFEVRAPCLRSFHVM